MTCTTHSVTEEGEGFLDKLFEWAKNHPYITAGAGGAIFLLMLASGEEEER